jgi:hypothetical protein
VRVFKTRLFAKFARREGIADASLAEAIARAERGLVDAELGGGVVKQRVARLGQGRSGGYRTLIAYRAGDFSVFLFGFAKSDRDNIGGGELEVLRSIARQWLGDASRIERDAESGILIEVEYGDDKS